MRFLLNKRMNNQTDEELIALYVQKFDNKCIGILFERYSALVFGVCLKYLKDQDLAKDAVLQLFEFLLIELPKNKILNFKSWLYVVSKNHCLKTLKEMKPVEFMENMEDSEDNPSTEDDSLHIEQITEQVQWAVNQLPIEQKRCVWLFYVEENSYKQITLKTGFTDNQVKSYIQNGKRNLKLILEPKV